MSMNCAVANHELVEGSLVTNPEHIKFIQKSNKDFRHREEICKRCKISMEFLYEKKMWKAKQIKKREARKKLQSVSSVSMSTMGSLSNVSEDDTTDRTPKHRSTNNVLARSRISNGNVSDLQESLKSVISPQRSKVVSSALVTSSGNRASNKSGLFRPIEAAAPPACLYPINISCTEVMSPTIYDEDDVHGPGMALAVRNGQDVPLQRKKTNDVPQRIRDARVQRNISKSPADTAKAVEPRHSNQSKRPADIAKPAESPKSSFRLSQEPSTSAAAGMAQAVRNGQDVPLQRKKTNDVQQRISDARVQRNISKSPADTAKAVESRHSNQSKRPADIAKPAESPKSSFRLSQEPSTSAAAASQNKNQQPSATHPNKITGFLKPAVPTGKTTATQAPAPSASAKRSLAQRRVEDEDVDDEPLYSLNAFNGTRLPHVQPIIKRSRKEFYHPNPDVMKIYDQGLIGG